MLPRLLTPATAKLRKIKLGIIYSLSTITVIVTAIHTGAPLVAACTITKSIMWPTAIASSPETKDDVVAPELLQTRFAARIFDAEPSLRCKLIVDVPLLVRHFTEVTCSGAN